MMEGTAAVTMEMICMTKRKFSEYKLGLFSFYI